MEEKRLKELIKNIEKFDLTEQEKSKYPGSFIKLKCGETHYEIKGEGENAVLVHGYATPYYIYDKIFDFLVSKGYRVLRYDLLGRGFSQRVDEDYTPSLFAEQLKEITDEFMPEGIFYLYGTSMGGAVTTAFAAKYPERVKKLFLLAPAGMNFNPPLYMKMAKVPGLGEIMFKTIGAKTLLKKCCSELIYSKNEEDYYMEKFAESIRYKRLRWQTTKKWRKTARLFAPCGELRTKPCRIIKQSK